MGRRALRKPNPELDLSRHLMTAEQLPRPWRQQAVFEREAPLEVEVGSGKGLFLSNASAANSVHNFMGIEVARKYAVHTAARLAKQESANARIVHGDAKQIFVEVFPDASLEAVHVYFPDPWWKARHRKRRMMSNDFVESVERTLRDGGLLHFWTDVEEYFQTTMELMLDFPNLEGPMEVPETPSEHELDFRTHFERRMRMHELPVYRSQFRRKARAQ